MNQELQDYVANVEAFEIDPGEKGLGFTGRRTLSAPCLCAPL